MLDDGRLTDSQGRTVDFRNTLIIMTSNIGADALAALPEGKPSSVSVVCSDLFSHFLSRSHCRYHYQAAKDAVMSAVRRTMAPEFINRIDEIVLFNRLERSVMADIVNVQLRGVAKVHPVLSRVSCVTDACVSCWRRRTFYWT